MTRTSTRTRAHREQLMLQQTGRRAVWYARRVPVWLAHRAYHCFLQPRGWTLARRVDARYGFSRAPDKTAWDSQYARLAWDCLGGLKEQARQGVLAAYVESLKPDGAILDVGCGDGQLLRYLACSRHARYVGIDLSDVAIGRAKAHAAARAEADRVMFEAADADTYVPSGEFDAIVWNESLYYFPDPRRAIGRYDAYLAPGGLYVTSLFRGVKSTMILQMLKRTYTLVDETRVTNRRGTWTCSVFTRPGSASAHREEDATPRKEHTRA
jgi:2-polyprenyl-3-methyl-5-hydroxy-6-metoxy-1,4-benzoquinol methylase